MRKIRIKNAKQHIQPIYGIYRIYANIPHAIIIIYPKATSVNQLCAKIKNHTQKAANL